MRNKIARTNPVTATSKNQYAVDPEIAAIVTKTAINARRINVLAIPKGSDPKKETNMTDERLAAEIRDTNLTYLMLAQNLIRKDKADALFRLGISEESANLIATLTMAQILKIASGNMLLCRFRVDDDIVWNLLTNNTVNKVDNDATTKLHASILMAGRFAEAM